jgi:hypothetical protein
VNVGSGAKPPFGTTADQLLLSDQVPAPTKRYGGATALTHSPPLVSAPGVG